MPSTICRMLRRGMAPNSKLLREKIRREAGHAECKAQRWATLCQRHTYLVLLFVLGTIARNPKLLQWETSALDLRSSSLEVTFPDLRKLIYSQRHNQEVSPAVLQAPHI